MSNPQNAHERIERSPGLLVLGILLLISVGGIVQIVPLANMRSLTEPIEGLTPYNALELTGRDVYVRESCHVCHSQLVRPFRAETERYGHYSVAGEFVYDRPFQFGSRRVGPDLARVGGRYSDEWQRDHLIDPRALVPESIMPGYPWLATRTIDAREVTQKIRALRSLGHPYSDADISGAGAAVAGKSELDALVAYLQRLGTVLPVQR
jgi:cytochrome c oxidase cbb3-type subunit 2